MNACRHCKKYHGEHQVCDEYIKWLECQRGWGMSEVIFKELISEIEKKNSWGKNELKNLILGLLLKHLGTVSDEK